MWRAHVQRGKAGIQLWPNRFTTDRSIAITERARGVRNAPWPIFSDELLQAAFSRLQIRQCFFVVCTPCCCLSRVTVVGYNGSVCECASSARSFGGRLAEAELCAETPSFRVQVEGAKKYCTLSNWLYVVASLRLLSVFLGYWYPRRLLNRTLKDELFILANSEGKKTDAPRQEFTGLTGRTFAVWTAVTCGVCVVTALHPENVPLLQLCTGTFGVAAAYFALEYGVYKTVSLKTVSRPAFFATASAAWCIYELNRLSKA